MPSQSVLEQKKAIVAELSERLKNSVTGVVVSYQGINTEDDTKLRKELRENNVKYTVVKNTLLSRACGRPVLTNSSPFSRVPPLLRQATASMLPRREFFAVTRRITTISR